MENFNNFPWWAQVVFVATNIWIVVILVILIRQALTTHKSQISNFLPKKDTNPAGERRKEYGSSRSSSYMDA